MEGKRIYFASDFHLGIDTTFSSKTREKFICQWMDQIKDSALALYILGDIFDFWFEYKNVIPRGFSRILGKIAEWTDEGIPIYIFRGNHDMWMFSYFKEEFGIEIFSTQQILEIGKHRFFLAHGDGLGPGDKGYKILKRIFANKLCQWLFARLHPNFAFRLAHFWSGKSRDRHPDPAELNIEMEKEWLYIFANEELDRNDIDYFIFGHRHIPINQALKNGSSRYINLGDWMSHFTYAEYDGEKVELRQFSVPDLEADNNQNG